MASALKAVTIARGEEMGQEAGAHGRDLVEMQGGGGVAAERALGHYGQHAGAGGGLQHGIARPDRGSLERGIGERQRRRELLEADLVLGALGVRGLQGGDRGQHGEHAAGTVRPGAGLPAHGAAVTLDEQHDGGLGGLVGVLPYPGAVGVGGAERAGHGGADSGGVEGSAGFEDRKQRPGGGDERVRAGGCGPCGRDGGKLGAHGCVRRLGGVEHGVLRIGIA